jgi:hypothetical protein
MRPIPSLIQSTIATLLFVAAVASANDISLSAERLSVSADDVTTYVGDVTLVVKLSTPIAFQYKSSKQSGTAEVMEGDVRIELPNLVITTQKATVTRVSGQLVIKMDTADSRESGR